MGILRSIKSLDSIADSIGPSHWHGFPRVPWLMDIADYGSDTASGVSVTQSSALRHPAVWAAVRVLSEDVAKLPLILDRYLDGGGKDRAKEHPLYAVLHDFANPDLTSYRWRQTMMGHLLTWGNCYSEKIYDRAGRLQLWPIKPDRIEPYWNSEGRKAFRYQDPREGERKLDAETVFHVAGFGYDGLKGYSPVSMARETIAEGQSAQRFASGFWRRGASNKVWFESPANWSDGDRTKFNDAVNAAQGGPNAHRSGVLPPGVKPTVITMPLEDAQFLETRQHNVTDVARWFRLPPHKIGDLEHATFSNIEHQSIEYVRDSLDPWLVNWEQEIRRQLMPDDGEYFPEFLRDALLRGDTLARAQANQIRFRNGTLTPDQWLAMENQNPHPNGMGKMPYISADLLPMGGPDESEIEDAPRLRLVKAARAFLVSESRNGHKDTDAVLVNE